MGTFYPNAADAWRELQEYSNLQIQGVYTHFACADDEDETFTLQQIAAFETALKECGISSSEYLIHAANSAAAQRFSQTYFGAIRSGIALYGAPPMGNEDENFAPVMSLKARVTEIREISAGRTVSYGATWTAKRDSKIALVPLGYADGYSRHLSNCGEVLLRGKRCPVVGRVTMDQIFVDTTELAPNIQVGEIVTAWGRDEAGVLHERSAVCPHLGCIVAWNSEEKSWDCPCHGSRFDGLGKVITGPSRADLAETGEVR